MLTMGSHFSGIAGFEFAGALNGIEVVWATEVEPFPIVVSKAHFPNMKHYGSITDVSGAELEPVDIITFGSPCTRLSVAGRHDGFDVAFKCEGNKEEPHDAYEKTIRATDKYQYFYKDTCPVCGKELSETNESALFFHAIRTINEMRDATGGVYPRIAVWENVPGALSSNNGRDFRAVLEEIAEAEIPMPPSGKWANAGMVRGNGREIAWRILDAQYWGVPQRRRRIFLICDFRGECAGEILFERQGLPGHPAEGRKAGQEVARSAGDGTETAGRYWDGGAVSDCLDCSVLAKRQTMPEKRRMAAVLVKEEKQKVFYESGPGWIDEGVGPLRASGGNNGGGSENLVTQPIAFNGRQDPVNGPVTGVLDKDGASQCVAVLGDKTHSLTSEGFDGSEDGTGRVTPIIAQPHSKGTDYLTGWDNQEKRIFTDKGVSPTLSGSDGGGGRTGCGYLAQLYDMTHAEEVIRPVKPGISPTLNARMGTGGNQIPVLMEPAYGFSAGQSDKARTLGFHEEVSPTLRAGASGTNMTPTIMEPVAFAVRTAQTGANGHGIAQEVAHTLDLVNGQAVAYGHIGYLVRRLTPMECERLQGFPDHWTDIHDIQLTGRKKCLSSDTARYKALGNSVAIPCVRWIMRRIRENIERRLTHEHNHRRSHQVDR